NDCGPPPARLRTQVLGGFRQDRDTTLQHGAIQITFEPGRVWRAARDDGGRWGNSPRSCYPLLALSLMSPALGSTPRGSTALSPLPLKSSSNVSHTLVSDWPSITLHQRLPCRIQPTQPGCSALFLIPAFPPALAWPGIRTCGQNYQPQSPQ